MLKVWGAIAVALLAAGCAGDNAEEKAAALLDQQVRDACTAEIELRLKAPATAVIEFASAEPVNDQLWTAAGTVDSENGFGALIRNDWECQADVSTGATFAIVEVGGEHSLDELGAVAACQRQVEDRLYDPVDDWEADATPGPDAGDWAVTGRALTGGDLQEWSCKASVDPQAGLTERIRVETATLGRRSWVPEG